MSSFARWIAKHAAFQPARPALVYEGRSISYGELAQRIEATVPMLAQQLGVAAGDRVAYLGYNSPELVILLFACARLGAVFVPMDGGLATAAQVALLRHCGAKVLVVEADFRQQAEGFHDQLPQCQLVASRFESSREASPWRALADLMQAARGEVYREAAPGAEAPVLLLYPGASSAQPRGVLLSQGALFYRALNSLHMHALSARDVVLAVLPMCSAAGLDLQALPALYAGATVVLHRRFDPAETLACMRVERPTLLALDGVGMAGLVTQEDWTRTDIGCLRALTASDAPAAAVRDAIRDRDVVVARVYGGAESGPVAVYQSVLGAEPEPESVGKAGMHTEVVIVGTDGAVLPPGKPGSVCVQGRSLFSAYWNDTDATAAVLSADGFRSEDTGYVDAQGNLFLS